MSNKEFYAVSEKPDGIKIGLQLYNLEHIHWRQVNWRIANSKTLLSSIQAPSTVSRKRQATSFEPLCGI